MDSERRLPPRIHLDLYTEDRSYEVARLTGLGARVVEWEGRPVDADYVIMEDPEGNRFCVVQGGDATSEPEVGPLVRRQEGPAKVAVDDVESRRVTEWSKFVLAMMLVAFVVWLAWTLIFRVWEPTTWGGLLVW